MRRVVGVIHVSPKETAQSRSIDDRAIVESHSVVLLKCRSEMCSLVTRKIGGDIFTLEVDTMDFTFVISHRRADFRRVYFFANADYVGRVGKDNLGKWDTCRACIVICIAIDSIVVVVVCHVDECTDASIIEWNIVRTWKQCTGLEVVSCEVCSEDVDAHVVKLSGQCVDLVVVVECHRRRVPALEDSGISTISEDLVETYLIPVVAGIVVVVEPTIDVGATFRSEKRRKIGLRSLWW